MTKFEWLANEFLLELFEYLNAVHLFRAFYGLNTRFNNLLVIHFRVYHLDFRSVLKREFHTICQRHLPSIIDRVISLHLSDDDETPNLAELFFLSYDYTFDQFYYLQSLSLDSIHSLPTLNRIILECHHLPYFTRLYITKCDFNDQDKFYYLIKNIWSLTKLRLCKIDHRSPYDFKFTNNTIISSSIENLLVQNFNFDFNDLSNLFQYTPSLRQFDATITYRSGCEQLHIVSFSIISLKLSIRNEFHSMINLFQNFPNLYRLIIKTQHIYLNGYEWKEIIMNYLPKIKIFRLRMDLKFSHPNNIEEQLNELLNSFRTYFWVEEHQWFVRCDCFSSGITNFAILYTLPYAFEEFIFTNKRWSKSTAFNDNKTYDRVNTLILMNIRTRSFNDSFPITNDFQNIVHLKITLPLNNTFWSFILSLEQLTSLDVTLVQGSDYLPLQALLHRSTYLYSLCFGNFSDLQIVSQLSSRSIHRLDFLKKNRYKKFFNSEQCHSLANSSLGRQCQVLLICVQNRIDILQLVNNISNLRSIIFQCKDDKWNDETTTSKDDEFIQWLQCHLSSTCLVRRDAHKRLNIRLWIER